MKYKHIIFDLDNTLLDYDLAETNALSALFDFYHVQGDFQSLKYRYKTINNGFWKKFEEGKVSLKELKIQRHKEFMTQIGKKDIDPEDCAQQYARLLSQNAFPLPGSHEILDYLKEKGYNLILASNGLPDVQYPRLEASDMLDYFSFIGISQEIGFQKPHVNFFSAIFASNNIDNKEEVLMIGDSINSDIKGGINAGIATCWYNPNDKISDIQADYDIRSLHELKEIL